jgi:hypothetical protein
LETFRITEYANPVLELKISRNGNNIIIILLIFPIVFPLFFIDLQFQKKDLTIFSEVFN